MTSATTMQAAPGDEQRVPVSDRASAAAIAFENVSKYFLSNDNTRLEVLRDISFRVPCGQIVAILGPSGAGKSTLLNLASGLIAPDKGRVIPGPLLSEIISTPLVVRSCHGHDWS